MGDPLDIYIKDNIAFVIENVREIMSSLMSIDINNISGENTLTSFIAGNAMTPSKLQTYIDYGATVYKFDDENTAKLYTESAIMLRRSMIVAINNMLTRENNPTQKLRVENMEKIEREGEELMKRSRITKIGGRQKPKRTRRFKKSKKSRKTKKNRKSRKTKKVRR